MILKRLALKQLADLSLGHIAEDNPDLTYAQIKDILLGLEEYNAGDAEEYKRGIL